MLPPAGCVNIKIKEATAFTLIELSIVLVIIGLIVGGVLVGQDLIRVASIKNITSDLQEYEMAIRVFKDKYGGLPGDMTNGTTFFPTSANGDGDKDMGIGNIVPYSSEHDGWRAWQQLALAGLVSGVFSGVQGPATGTDAVIGTNVPPSSLGTGVTINNFYNYAGDVNHFPGDGNLLMVGRDAGTWTYTGFLSPQEMYSIDKKFDGDLSPATGKIQSWKGGSTHTPNCTTTDLAATAEYHVTNSDGLCNFIYMLE